MNILVIGAHPDDELLGVAGTIARHIKNGDDVFVYLLTDGHTSRYRDNEKIAEHTPEVVARIESAKKAAAFLGIKELEFAPFNDQRLDTVPMIELVQDIEKYASKINPEIVYTHHRGDVNRDHQVTFTASLTAFRSTGEHYPKRLLCYETISSTEWGAPFAESVFMPNVFIDISDFMDIKLQALDLYRQEMRDFPHPRSMEGIRTSAKRWGSVIGTQAAEAFMLVREVI